MKIVQCAVCKKYMHNSNKCLYCGNTAEFHTVEMPNLHERVIWEYRKVESLIENKKFDEAFALSHTITEWAPQFSGIFWLRLLAKKKCAIDSELILKGFDCDNDPDFYNALRFSTNAEHNAYLSVQDAVHAVKNALKSEVLKHGRECKIETNILEFKKKMKCEMDTRKEKLYSLYSELREEEYNLYVLEKDCRLVAKEYVDSLRQAVLDSSNIKTETYNLAECSTENYHQYQVRMASVFQQSERAKNTMDKMKKEQPWVRDFEALSKKRDETVSKIEKEISSLKAYGQTLERLLDDIDRIEKRHCVAVKAVEQYDFLDAVNLLGEDCCNNVLHKIGLNIDFHLTNFFRN